ncbi:protein suppressor of k(+) transport growth defect 1 [Quercus suber]|uniref:Protein suppressor of k(+) transport growth defect 1 n=1 Tax=Quercus suber TaxID=58331 RepID=A0AAW0L4A2_QUESU
MKRGEAWEGVIVLERKRKERINDLQIQLPPNTRADFDKMLARQKPTVSEADLEVHKRFKECGNERRFLLYQEYVREAREDGLDREEMPMPFLY